MAIQNSLNLVATGVITADGAGAYTGSTVTQYGAVIAGASNAISSVAPTATVGTALVSTGASANPEFGTVSIGGGGTGSTSFTAGSVVFSNGTILTQDNANLFWDDTNNYLGIGTATPDHTLTVNGGMDIIHTAAENDDHALEIDVDAAGFGDVKAVDIVYTSGAVAATENEEAILINIDETASTGGEIVAMQTLTTTEGSAAIIAAKMGPGVDAIRQEVGTFGNMDSALNKAVDVLAALSSGGAGNITMFVADNDTVTIGDAASFGAMEIIVDTGASGSGIAPTFEYSTGIAMWATFSPVDGTNGFRNTGVIEWDVNDLPGFATGTGTEYLIRITRTRNSLSTAPIVDEVQIAALTEFKWDKNGDVNLSSLTLVTPLVVGSGGTGASTLTDHGILLGSGTSAITALGSATNGQLPIGSTGADPTLATITGGTGITVTNGAGSISIAADTEGSTFLGSVTASSSSTLDFESLIDSTYNSYLFIFDNLVSSTSSTLKIRTSTDNGSTYDSGSSDYTYNNFNAYNNANTSGSVGSGPLSTASGTTANETMNGQMVLINPSGTGYTYMYADCAFYAGGFFTRNINSVVRESAADVDAVQFSMGTVVTSGTISIYGMTTPS